jgi:hypothetical protein
MHASGEIATNVAANSFKEYSCIRQLCLVRSVACKLRLVNMPRSFKILRWMENLLSKSFQIRSGTIPAFRSRFEIFRILAYSVPHAGPTPSFSQNSLTATQTAIEAMTSTTRFNQSQNIPAVVLNSGV